MKDSGAGYMCGYIHVGYGYTKEGRGERDREVIQLGVIVLVVLP